MSDVLNDSANWIFINYVGGARGYFLARCLATCSEVAWYDHPKNGANPWDWNKFSVEESHAHSPAHFMCKWNTGLHTWSDRNIDFLSHNPNAHTKKIFQQDWLNELLLTKKVIIPCHFTPFYLKKYFPNSKIVQIDNSDNWLPVLKQYFDKTSAYKAANAVANYQDDYTPVAQKIKFVEWHAKTGQNTIRDWEQYNLDQTLDEWMSMMIKDLKQQHATMLREAFICDYIMKYDSINNIAELADLCERLDLTPNAELLKLTVENFNLDLRIKKLMDNL